MDPIQRPPSAPSAIFWRQPPGPIPAGTPMLVAPTECVVAVHGGAVVGMITPGSYALHPRTFPFLGPTLDAGSNVTAELWFVFTDDFRGCKFGGPLGRHLDPSLGLEATPLVHTGEYSMKVVDPPSFVQAHMSMADGATVVNAVSGTVLAKMKELVSRLVAEKHSMLQLGNVPRLLEGLNPMLGDLNSVGLSVQVQNVSVAFSDEDRKALIAASAEKAAAGRAARIAEMRGEPAPAAAPGTPPLMALAPGAAVPRPASRRNSGLIVGGLVAVVVLTSIVAAVMHAHAPPSAAPQHHGKH
jgi:membrane protease subunit (stomatin/prohibitin family)